MEDWLKDYLVAFDDAVEHYNKGVTELGQACARQYFDGLRRHFIAVLEEG